jgi:hypothetical protein
MKIAICTPYNTNPLHPRTESLKKVLEKKHQVTIFSFPNGQKTFINRLFMGFYDLSAINQLKKKIKPYDLIYIQDLKFLPLSIYARRKKKKVIYESLDNNVYLLFYLLVKKYKFFKFLGFIPKLVSFSEKIIASNFTDQIIVNSKALQDYFNNKAKILYYSSPLEGISNLYNKKAFQSGFLYLGWFCKMKGAEIILDFIENQKAPLFIIGSINEPEILDRVKKNENIQFFDRMNSSSLKIKIEEILSTWFLFGFSLTQDVNRSNATQELNKDIDYLCIGIPIIGNRRGPTKEKIDMGYGFYIDDFQSINLIMSDQNKLAELSENCKKYYNAMYSSEIFSKKLNQLISDVAGIH